MGRALGTALLFGAIAHATALAEPTTLDLADIVGGGDGSGSGASAGVDLNDGSTTTTQTGPVNAPTNTFVPADNPLIDGVFVPDGGPGGSANVPISSTGLSVSGISDSTDPGSAHTWDHVWNGTNFNTSTTWSGAILGMHANKGVTFDLEAIGAAYGLVPDAFTAMPITGTSATADVDYYAFVDGLLVAQETVAGADGFASELGAPLDEDARFLTLLTSSKGLSSGDWSGFLDPTLDLVRPLTLGQIDSFDTDRDGWARGLHLVEEGDGYLRIPGPEGSHTITFHQGEQWAGDYPAVGVGRLRVDLRNEGPDAIHVYLAFGTSAAPSLGGEWLATATPVDVPIGAGWGTYDIPIGPGDLVSVQGEATYGSVMPNVESIRILHNTQPDTRGLIGDSFLCIDNIEALPEPAWAAGFGAGAALLSGLAQRHRRRVPARRSEWR